MARYRKKPVEVEAWRYVGVDQITPEHPENITAQMSRLPVASDA